MTTFHYVIPFCFFHPCPSHMKALPACQVMNSSFGRWRTITTLPATSQKQSANDRTLVEGYARSRLTAPRGERSSLAIGQEVPSALSPSANGPSATPAPFATHVSLQPPQTNCPSNSSTSPLVFTDSHTCGITFGMSLSYVGLEEASMCVCTCFPVIFGDRLKIPSVETN